MTNRKVLRVVRTIKANFAMASHKLNNGNIKDSFEADKKSYLVCLDLINV